MKNKSNKPARKKDTGSLIFSAILITAFVICSYFFMNMIDGLNKAWLQSLLCILVFVIFGLFLFYATRVGDGKQIVRFSPATLIIMDLPALYIILAAMIGELPLSEQITSCAPLIYLASITLGYGIPYTFVSGYEIELNETSEQPSEAEDDDDFVIEPEGSGEVVIKEDDDEDFGTEGANDTSDESYSETEEKE